MIKGYKHEWCGNTNWNGEKCCPRCDVSGIMHRVIEKFPNAADFTEVTFDNPELEALVPIINEVAKSLCWQDQITIGFIKGYESTTDEDAVDAIDIDGFYVFQGVDNESLDGSPRFGWDVETSVVIHNYPNEPDDCEPVNIKTMVTKTDAILTVFKCMFDQRLESIGEALYYRDYKDSDITIDILEN